MRILLIEDDQMKAGSISRVISKASGGQIEIVHKLDIASAYNELLRSQFDLCLLDVVLPRRLGDEPTRDGGLELLRKLSKDQEIFRPRYIVGISGYAEVVETENSKFLSNLWCLLHFSDTTDEWKGQLVNTVQHIRAVLAAENSTDGQTFGCELAIVCAVEDVEFEALKRVEFDWKAFRRPFDDTRYLEGKIHKHGREGRVIAAAAPRMGMAATSALACKVISAFRPKYLAMVGICAGRSEKANLGDVVVASPSWDWGSGKIESVEDEEGQSRFLPAPHQIDMDPDLLGEMKELAQDVELLAKIKGQCTTKKPDTEVKVRIGPMVTGAAVVADKLTFDALVEQQHRKILGIDMEAYSVFISALSMGKPRPKAMVFKGVSDFADIDKDDDVQPYAAEVSARLLKAFIQKID